MGRVVALGLLALATAATAKPLDDNVHLGVASCATGVCHGKLTAQPDRNVQLNEYRIWSADDRHARAYQTLLSPESKRIATKLGLPNAQGAAICLDCHADNVPQEQRGPKFQVTDGVGCEACHGGAGQWIESHTEPGASHADNLARGMLATEDIDTRAEVCLSCHLGTRDQFATHRIMGAGHPRLSFELEAYTANQPAHFTVDDDYRERKGAPSGFDVWRAGQITSARRYLALLQSDLYAATDAIPDFAFYDCHSCHHPMDDLRWPDFRRRQGLAPGAPRLQDQHLFMLRAVSQVLAPADESTLDRHHVGLLRAGQRSVGAAKSAAAELDGWLASRGWLRGSAAVDRAGARAVRAAIAALAADGLLADYAAAEQAFLGMESLSIHLGDAGALQDALDTMYGAVESDTSYDPARFREAARRFRDRL